MAEGAKAYQDGQESNAEMFYLAALENLQNAGPEDPRLAATLNTLAVLYHAQKKYAQAEPLYQGHSVFAGVVDRRCQRSHKAF
jgi:hypothetical protein